MMEARVAADRPDAPDPALPLARVLDRILSIQRAAARNTDPGSVWASLLDAVLDLSGSAHGVLREFDETGGGGPVVETRAVRWHGGEALVDPHPDVLLLMSEVARSAAPLLLNRPTSQGDVSRFTPIDGFLGLPLVSSDRVVGVIGLTGPDHPYHPAEVAALEPLLLSCAAIVESIQSARERERVNSRLAGTAAFLESVIESSTHGVVVVTAAGGHIESANSAAAELFGASVEALVGSRIRDLVDERSAGQSDEILAAAASGGLGEYQRTFKTSAVIGGAERQLEVTLSEFDIDGVPRVVSLFRDITQQVAAERLALRARAVLDQAPDLVAWTDTSGAIQYVNSGGRRMTGRSEEEVLGASLHSFIPDWQQERVRDEVIPTAVFDGSWSGELTFLGPDGEFPVWLVALSGMEDDLRYLAFLARDLREREEIDRMKSRFISNITHELRTPLTSIIGYVELLRDGSFGALDDRPAEVLEIVEKNGERLLELIGDILRLTSFDSERQAAHSPVDLTDVVSTTIERLRLMAGPRAISTGLVGPRVIVDGDRTELEAMLTNIVANAIKFSGDDAEIDVTLESSRDTVTLVVADTGVGIPEAEMSELFTRFHRGSDARRRELPGTGLGLAIVDAVVRRHGGTIEVESKVAAGTRFTITLPARERSD